MAETRGEAREGGNVKVEREVETEIQIGRDDEEAEGGEGGESIEMRTARDAKAVPSRGVGVGVGVPLEHHLTPDQLANLTLESRRIKVMHTDLTPKHLPNRGHIFLKKIITEKIQQKKLEQIEIFRCGTNPPISTSRSQVRPARVRQPPLHGTPTASPPSKSMFGWGKSR